MRASQRIALRMAATELVETARKERALLEMRDPERVFLLGVDAAAQEVLQPELGSARSNGWLERHESTFREGYARAKALFAAATMAPATPLHLPLPRMISRPVPANRHDRMLEQGERNASETR